MEATISGNANEIAFGGSTISMAEFGPLCEAPPVALIWVTGNSGVGKSTVCDLLKRRGWVAVDADWEGYSHWVDRVSGQVVADPPFPVPAGWLDRYGWRMAREKVESLAARAATTTVFLCGSAENGDVVDDLFDLVICLVVDDETLTARLASRTTNSFGSHPEELAAALRANRPTESVHRRPDVVIIDGTQPIASVVDAVLSVADV
ncbi:AAA family ATPase [Jidongwangia harbinensis]|uniref:AAA family ATPase n=1 Tax=Jidongwangia harbinensis TaxID=2878561 RepID=UPI001CD9C5C7|nr:AAA family ATPase [Jidongwangia harbinensis]MCA2218379.1 AAA family ATPase [Jidongwangia harbinensis]